MNDVTKLKFELGLKDPHEGYYIITNNFLKVVIKHAPLKKKTIRGNNAPYMNKEFRKAIYTRTRTKNKFLKNPSEQNEILFKKQRNICKSKEKKYQEPPKQDQWKRDIHKQRFSELYQTFFNKDFVDSTDITLKLDNKIITDEAKLVESFNNHYISIVEQSSGLKPTAIGQKGLSDKAVICSITESYHPSIKQIRNN